MADMNTGKLMAALEGREFPHREIVDKWLLVTYDIPINRKGVRYAFLKKAFALGAKQHTRSVYLMPHTREAEIAIYRLSREAEAYVWTAAPTEGLAAELTKFYDGLLQKDIDELETRAVEIAEHQKAGHQKQADRMLRTGMTRATELLLNCARRGAAELAESVALAVNHMEQAADKGEIV